MDPQIEAQIAAQRRAEQDYQAWAGAQAQLPPRQYVASPPLSAPPNGEQDASETAPAGDSAAVCHARLPSGHYCGVAALGRCVDCLQAFCLSHQAVVADGGTFTNLCSTCLISREARVRDAAAHAAARAASARADQAQQEQDALTSAQESIRAVAARLTRTGAPGLTPRSRVIRQKQTIPGWTRWRDVTQPLPAGWLVGRFDWIVYHAGTTGTFESDARSERAQRATYVLPNGDVVSDEPRNYGFGGTPKRPADLMVWLEISRAFTQLATKLERD